MRVIRWRKADTGVESLTITANGVYFPVGKTDSGFKLKLSMASAGQSASVDIVRSANGDRAGYTALSVSGTTVSKAPATLSLSYGIVVSGISGTLNAILDDETPISSWPDYGIGRFPAVEDLVAYTYGSTPPVGLRATVGAESYVYNGASWSLAQPNVQTDKLIGSISQSLLAGAPLQVTGDNVVATLGPTAQGVAVAEYNTLKTNRLEWKYFSGASLINQDKLGAAGTAWVDNPYSLYARPISAPWPRTNGTTDWWAKGYNELVVDGEGVIAFVYVLNAPNACSVFVDGKILSSASSDGKISNGVASTANAYQWVVLNLTGDKRRVICTQGPVSLVSVIHDPGITLSKVDYVGKAIVFGDSFASRGVSAGETSLIQFNIAVSALRLLGWNSVDTATGGTGFVANGGGNAQQKDSYSGYIDRLLNDGVPLGFNPSEYTLVWLYGTGNDQGKITTSAQYLSVIQKALSAFPNATIAVSSVYEGFNTVDGAKALNDMLYAAVQAAGPRVKWVPVDSFYKWDKLGIWSGSGCVPAPARNGNADVYFSNATQGAGDRHPNAKGCAYGAKYYASELIRAGIPYRKM